MFATISRLAGVLALTALAACGGTADLAEKPEPLGNFRLGHNIVVAKNATKLPLSRPASAEELKSTLTGAIQDRMGRYEGEKLYHLGVNIDGFLLAVPGVPVVASPKSALIISVNVWDDAKGAKTTERSHQITVLEQISGETIVGSGLTQSREVQLKNLTENAARAIEKYLRANPQWFEGPAPVAAGAAAAATAGTAPGTASASTAAKSAVSAN
ncbi:hypothetical protein CLV77_2813 [Brevirhabdus pacifica]|uniref:hypothetical protein n=1 Tax=Brevirhabdus pacifica TaxID=1267768 RepID=UPI000CB8BA4C|nr:hypothetical protein [Brevirhabdus pacifica]PJJ80544.1 hypothetical protein CLV77_2813 [Brevirhabdus pacifica]